MSTEPLATYSIIGTKVTVYSNRIEIQTGGGLFGKKETIAFRHIASVTKPAMLNRLDITTNDKKTYKIALSSSDLAKLKEQIESSL